MPRVLGEEDFSLAHFRDVIEANRARSARRAAEEPRPAPWKHLVAGTAAGVTATGVLHPLDLVKTRMQSRSTALERMSGRAMFRAVLARDGWRALYAGVTPAMFGSGMAWGLYFVAYGNMTRVLQDFLQVPYLSSAGHLFAGAAAGCMTAVVTQPVWLMKTRMELQAKNGQYRNLFQGLRLVYTEAGGGGAAMRELWKGLVPSLWAVSHGAIQFSIYARFKRFYLENDGMGQGLLFHHHLAFGAASKICATVVTYPLQMCRTRLQDHRLPKADQYRGMLDVMRTVVRTDGWFGFWRGIGPTILRVTPASAITLMMYEQVRLVLGLFDDA